MNNSYCIIFARRIANEESFFLVIQSVFSKALYVFIVGSITANAQTKAELYLDEFSEEPIGIISNGGFKPRPKFIEFNIETFRNFQIQSQSALIGDESATVSQNLIRELKLKFPIILKDSITLIGGLAYRHEQFKFSDQSDIEYPLFERFDDRSLNRRSFSLLFRKKLRRNRFIYSFFNGSLNSDQRNFESFGQQLKLSSTTIYGKNINVNKQIGFGASFGYDFGQPELFPVLLLTNDFSKHWGYEFLLPKSMKLRYSANEFNQFFATIELKGASYYLQREIIDGFEDLEFRRSSVRFSLAYERELYDWLWLGISAGYRVPINIFISEPRKRRNEALITIDAQSTAYMDVSIFIVPPRKLYSKVQ